MPSDAEKTEKKEKKRKLIPGLCDECVELPLYVDTEQAIIDDTLLESAAEGHVECVNACLKAGANVNYAKDSLRGDGVTALMYAALNGRVNFLQLLIDEGADVNKQDLYGDSALINAAQVGYVKYVKLLIKEGADVNIENKRGDTALTLAAQNGNPTCIKALVEAGADVNSARGDDTVLMFAARRGSVGCVQLLVESGADVNGQDKDGRTVLMLAGSWEGIPVEGASKQDIADYTAAFYRRIVKIAKILLRAGARVNMQDREGSNALTTNLRWAARNQKLNMLLFAAGETLKNWKSEVPDYLKHDYLKLNLKHLCRETIRKHLINVDPHQHLFDRIPQLGLPSSLVKYLLYDVSLDDDDGDVSDDDDEDDDGVDEDHANKHDNKHKCSDKRGCCCIIS